MIDGVTFIVRDEPAVLIREALKPLLIEEVRWHNKVPVHKYLTCEVDGLRFKTNHDDFSDTPFVRVWGSLHMYKNYGRHNSDDYTRRDFYETIENLRERFNIHPSDCILTNIEFGVNVEMPFDIGLVLRNFLFFRRTPFTTTIDSPMGHNVLLDGFDFQLKAYNKGRHYKHYTNDRPILRFELKLRWKKRLRSLGVITMEDLINTEFNVFKELLLAALDNTIIYESLLLDGTKYEDEFGNIRSWEKIRTENNRWKYKKAKYRQVLDQCTGTIKEVLRNCIAEKANYLSSN